MFNFVVTADRLTVLIHFTMEDLRKESEVEICVHKIINQLAELSWRSHWRFSALKCLGIFADHFVNKALP